MVVRSEDASGLAPWPFRQCLRRLAGFFREQRAGQNIQFNLSLSLVCLLLIDLSGAGLRRTALKTSVPAPPPAPARGTAAPCRERGRLGQVEAALGHLQEAARQLRTRKQTSGAKMAALLIMDGGEETEDEDQEKHSDEGAGKNGKG
ncbi:unnamed protein product [Prorocentrum cordatum]|uniref:Uncharacterized protein n=1 Tax=Prorocentrum cordatum TaxID=2364126 RepID=A0ABN9V993_9DINO|nr:unnamed protein product [Polarella glacialis]